MGRRAAQVLLLTAAVGVCALAAEWAVRSVFHAAPQLHMDIYRKDAEGRLLLRPNLVRRHVGPKWDVEIRTNAQGRRDHDAEPKAGQPVVLGLGDSQAFGWGVEVEESFYSVAERDAGLTVVNAAVPGTGPWDYLRALELLGPEVEPELAVVSVFVGNDFYDAARGEAGGRYDVDEGLLITPGQTSWKDRLARRSHLLQLMRAMQFNLQRSGESLPGRARIWDEAMREFAEIHLREPTPRAQQGYDEMLRALEALRGWCGETDVTMAVLLIPRSWQTSDEERMDMQAALGYSEDDLDLYRPQRKIQEWGETNGVPVWGLPEEVDADLFFTPDAHLNPSGHRRLGAILARGLERRFNEGGTIESNAPTKPETALLGRAQD